MTTIPEAPNEDIEEMDFVDWNTTTTSTSCELPASSDDMAQVSSIDPAPTSWGSDDPSMGLVFGDVEGDDWSFWALQHFESTQLQQDPGAPTYWEEGPEGTSLETSQFSWEVSEAPCTNCSQWSYQCKRIREGKYKGYCTSCVALRRECSFGPSTKNLASERGAAFPADPWPTMGDRPETSIVHEHEMDAGFNSGSAASLVASVAEEMPLSRSPQHPPKIGARFSRESVKVLRNWVATHSNHPYPTDEERENLQKITGLNKTQITNWLANARRRGKIQTNRAISPLVGPGYAKGVDIPPRRGTPGPFESMNPMQRWENSPPENEPASVTAIALAVSASGSYSATSGSGRTSPNVWNLSDDGSNRSLCNQSSASSLGTSHSSGGSFASLFSSQSRSSSIPSFVRSNRGRRRRRRVPPTYTEKQLTHPTRTFQCTFCTESFRTKHDWQRHEKSLHLSLERWICSPDGARAIHPDNGLVSCVFCGEAGPDDAHIETHNFSSCVEHTQEERSYYRKDHLRQHLRLVHNVKFQSWSMETWRTASPEIRSRCGFCDAVLDNWASRTDHLAEHFKTGSTMADWKGDWGFDAPVLELVENSIPPYLINDERQSPLPFRASQPPPGTATNAYELLKIELQWWVSNKIEELGAPPLDSEIQQEACRILYGAEVMLKGTGMSSFSWLRDLVMCSEEAQRQAAFRPRAPGSNSLSSLRINGKSDIFESCSFERELQDYVHAKLQLGLTAMDHELQDEACGIINRMEEKSSNPSEFLVNWLIRMAQASPSWLKDFRQRAGLPRSEDVGDPHERSTDPRTIDSTIHNYARLEAALGKYVEQQRQLGNEPTDSDLQRQARIFVYEVDDMWNQTAADDKTWLGRFKEKHPPGASRPNVTSGSSLSNGEHVCAAAQPSKRSPDTIDAPGERLARSGTGLTNFGSVFMNDANCFRRLAEDLGRFVAATVSPNNPNRHVPTDEELEHQARWIIYNDGDPFNQTAANNAEWLQRFKVDAGLLPPGSGPGLGMWSGSYNAHDGGIGFEPPYVFPNPAVMAEPFGSTINTATGIPRTASKHYQAPAKVFCSRELEKGLTEYVKREVHRSGVFPSDAQLQQRARDILNVQRTPCENPILLGKFKAALQGSIPTQQRIHTGAGFDVSLAIPSEPVITASSVGLSTSMTAPGPGLSALAADDMWPADMNFNLGFTEEELNKMFEGV
ncbi:hypothetical protein F4861DRAFT_497117 [Xylaria intraflava]|nr:hypothetical protein F4861DRAFT_497117 [Xylaria intraflava]